jgi:hypothetical protein
MHMDGLTDLLADAKLRRPLRRFLQSFRESSAFPPVCHLSTDNELLLLAPPLQSDTNLVVSSFLGDHDRVSRPCAEA